MSLMVTGLFAQQRGQGQGMRNQSPDEQANQQLERLKKIVKVEKKEEAKLKEIFLKSAKEGQKKMAEMRKSGDREGMRDAIDKLNKSRDEELKTVLGEKRMKTYLDEMERIRQERGGQRRF